jgi:hypothetical protein
MFRPKSEQARLFTATTLLPEAKMRRLQASWAWEFRSKALPLIDEEAFSSIYCPDNGRPNMPVKTVIGLLLLKEMEDLTDEQALFDFEFNLAWQVALEVDPEVAHCCQKTLHNFRTNLVEHKLDMLVFQQLTDRILAALGVDIGKQRMDSTHILSNIARLTRLGLLCETIRVFLRALATLAPEKFEKLPSSLRRRYLKDDGRETRFGDASSKDSRRRLGVCARDTWRLVDRFAGDEQVHDMEAFGLLERLLEEQCEVVAAPAPGASDDEDAEELPVPVVVKDPKKVGSDSLQTPHDPDVTYSGHKGKGYEVQVAETHGNEGLPEIITYVEVTRSCDSDAQAAVPAVLALIERGIQPKELEADTTYGSTKNAIECAKLGTELVSPVPGGEVEPAKDGELRKGDFLVDPAGDKMTTCPAGQMAANEARDAESGRIRVEFDGAACAQCPQRDACPTRTLREGTRVLQTTHERAVLVQRRRYEQTEEFQERYAPRAGIEASNSELKRGHGLGHIRTRGQERVRLAVSLKATACNVKRMLNHEVERAAAARHAAAAATEGLSIDNDVAIPPVLPLLPFLAPIAHGFLQHAAVG